MTTRQLVYILTLISLFLLTGCSLILGIHKIKRVTDEQVLKTASKIGIPKSDLYALDTTFFKYIFSFDQKKYSQQTKNHYQPLQALYFDKRGVLTKFYVNCYAGGVIKLNWNRDGRLNSFLPKDQAPVDSIINFSKQLLFLKPIGNSTLADLNAEKNDFTVLIYWNIFMRRYSKQLIKEIRKNCKLANGKMVKIVYVNDDNFIVEVDK